MYIPISGHTAPGGFGVIPFAPLAPTFAEDNIPCYKYVFFKEGNLTSPYFGFLYDIGKQYVADGDFLKIAGRGGFYYVIEGGGFHSFISPSDCFEEYDLLEKEGMVMVKCHIPKGTYYYIGENVNGIPNYVSRSIVIDEIINDD